MKLIKIIFFPITILVWGVKKLINKFSSVRIGKFLTDLTLPKIDTLTGEQFEDVCKLMFQFAGYNVKTTPASNDYGADLVISKKLTIVVQAKLYYKHGVGNHSVQEVTSAIKYYNAHFACVITNWKFTKQAQTMAQMQSVVLIDRQDVEDFLLDVKQGTKHSKMFNLEKHFKPNVNELQK
ncbi:MAG: restriction endonuclease [Clostridia bacterium]|nr:restriction endonuclease [Clostridia bacterium]